MKRQTRRVLSVATLLVALTATAYCWGLGQTSEWRTLDEHIAVYADGTLADTDWGSHAIITTDWGAWDYLTVTTTRNGFDEPWVSQYDWHPRALRHTVLASVVVWALASCLCWRWLKAG